MVLIPDDAPTRRSRLPGASFSSSASTMSLDSVATSTGTSSIATTRHSPYATPVVETPQGTFHTALMGKVTFVPYPATPFYPVQGGAAGCDGTQEVVRLFFGQLPHFVTAMQVSWLCATFAGGRVVSDCERILKKGADGARHPTGCLHGYASATDADVLCRQLNKRLLIDDTGVWFAQNTAEQTRLAEYLTMIRKARSKRLPGRPYDTVVVQLAVSTYIPLNPTPLTETLPPNGALKPSTRSVGGDAASSRHRRQSKSDGQRKHNDHPEVELGDRFFEPAPRANYVTPTPQPQAATPFVPQAALVPPRHRHHQPPAGGLYGAQPPPQYHLPPSYASARPPHRSVAPPPPYMAP